MPDRKEIISTDLKTRHLSNGHDTAREQRNEVRQGISIMLFRLLILLCFVVAVSGCGDREPASEADRETAKLFKAAEKGDAAAQVELGLKYYHGKGVPKDFAQAVEWFQKAATRGDVKAQSYLGSMYARGECRVGSGHGK